MITARQRYQLLLADGTRDATWITAAIEHLMAADPDVSLGEIEDVLRAGAKSVLEQRGVIDRCDIVGGRFFETVPEGGDAYIMRVVIHDWEDDEAIAILRTCRRAMQEVAKLILIKRIVAPPNEIPATKFSDLNMLVLPGGRERTREEFSDLFAKTGFELTRVAPAGNVNVIEARPH
jgi:hypothetical protein